MAKLTDRRLNKAKAILDRYRDLLLQTHELDTVQLERELKDLWNLGYQELKEIMIDLSKRKEYVLLAARYMEGGFPGVVSEFQSTLAKLYGITHYDAIDREEKQAAFWQQAFA